MTQKINRILCTIGMRGNCDKVLEQSVNLALATGANLHVLHVVKTITDDVLNTLKANIRDRDVLGSLIEQRTAQSSVALAAEMDAFWGRFPELKDLSLIHISEPTRRTPISYAV